MERKRQKKPHVMLSADDHDSIRFYYHKTSLGVVKVCQRFKISAARFRRILEGKEEPNL